MLFHYHDFQYMFCERSPLLKQRFNTYKHLSGSDETQTSVIQKTVVNRGSHEILYMLVID